MSQFLFLDSGPLGLLTHPQRSPEVIAIAEWLSRCLLSGGRVIVPAIVYYELRRELLRAKKTFGIARLDAFIGATGGARRPGLAGWRTRIARVSPFFVIAQKRNEISLSDILISD